MLQLRAFWTVVAAALLSGLALLAIAGEGAEAVPGQPSIDVTSGAVQTFYQDGVPHTSQTGALLSSYSSGESVFPRGIYWPAPCTVAYGFSWPAYMGSPDFDGDGVNDWDGSYRILATLAGLSPEDERAVVRDVTRTQTSMIDIALPADTDLTHRVYAGPVSQPDAPLVYEQTINLSCPASDADDPNAIETLAAAGFNRAISTWAAHPRLLIELKDRAASADGFAFVIDARQGACFNEFAEQLFRPGGQGGQGYSQHPDIYGWQMEDEPLLRTANTPATSTCAPPAGCSSAALDTTIDRLASKALLYGAQTQQVLFSIEGAPQWFPAACDPNAWDGAVGTGDAGDHDNYIRHAAPLTTLQPIAESVSRQTEALGEARPSWFTAQAFDGSGFVLPSPQENRASVYTAIVSGATGLWYFALDGVTARGAGLVGIRPDVPPSYPESAAFGGRAADANAIASAEALWSSIGDVNQEVEDLTPVLLSPTSTFPYRVLVSSRPNGWSPVRTMLKYVDGEHYLIAVNVDGVANDVKFDFAYPMASGQVMFEDRTVAPGPFVDHFEPFDVHVYQMQFEDSDGDGVDNVADNCVVVANANQLDGDGDWIGFACDPDDSRPDTDRDGCNNDQEKGTVPAEGGLRDPELFWDFYDVPTGPSLSRDRAVSGTDLFALLQRFASNDGIGSAEINRFSDPLSPVSGTGYHPAFDRSRPPPGEWWRSRAPDGAISGFDFFALVGQFGHRC